MKPPVRKEASHHAGHGLRPSSWTQLPKCFTTFSPLSPLCISLCIIALLLQQASEVSARRSGKLIAANLATPFHTCTPHYLNMYCIDALWCVMAWMSFELAYSHFMSSRFVAVECNRIYRQYVLPCNYMVCAIAELPTWQHFVCQNCHSHSSRCCISPPWMASHCFGPNMSVWDSYVSGKCNWTYWSPQYVCSANFRHPTLSLAATLDKALHSCESIWN